MKKIISLVLSFCLYLQPLSVHAAAATPNSNAIGIAIYNSISTNQLLETLKVQASPSDKKYLSSLNGSFENKKLPQARVDGNYLYLFGLDAPITIVDANAGKFKYNGLAFTFDPKMSIEKNIGQIEAALVGKKTSSLFNLVAPEAKALAPLAISGLTIYGLVGIIGFAGCFSYASGFDHPIRPKETAMCAGLAALWPALAAIGFLMFATSASSDAKTIPARIEHSKSSAGIQSIKITNPNGKEVKVTVDGDKITTEPPIDESRKKVGDASVKTVVAALSAMNQAQLKSLNTNLTDYHQLPASTSTPAKSKTAN